MRSNVCSETWSLGATRHMWSITAVTSILRSSSARSSISGSKTEELHRPAEFGNAGQRTPEDIEGRAHAEILTENESGTTGTPRR